MLMRRRRVPTGRGHSRVRGQWSVCQSATCSTMLPPCPSFRRPSTTGDAAMSLPWYTTAERCHSRRPLPRSHDLPINAPLSLNAGLSCTHTTSIPGSCSSGCTTPYACRERYTAPNPTTTLNPTRTVFNTPVYSRKHA